MLQTHLGTSQVWTFFILGAFLYNIGIPFLIQTVDTQNPIALRSIVAAILPYTYVGYNDIIVRVLSSLIMQSSWRYLKFDIEKSTQANTACTQLTSRINAAKPKGKVARVPGDEY